MTRFLRSSATVLALWLAGPACTAVGYGIGAAADAGDKTRFTPSAGAATPFAPGQRVRVVQKDGSVIVGKYRGIHTATASGDGQPPSQAGLSVVRLEEQGNSGTRDIPADQVALIESKPRSGRTVGLVVGAVLDVVGVIATIANPPGSY